MSTAADALKYAAAILKARVEWTTEGIGGSECNADHEIELDAINNIARDVLALAAQFGDPDRYSDSRTVKTIIQIVEGLTTEHIWWPDPTEEKPSSWRGNLSSGHPDIPSPGLYQVSTEPSSQEGVCQRGHDEAAR